jgi:YgiT-type zinc finger domain-containing protein
MIMDGTITIESTCPFCDKDSVEKIFMEERFSYGVGEDAIHVVATHVPVFSCSKCGEQWTDGDGEGVRHAALCRAIGVLSPPEVIKLRNEFGWSQQQLAAAVNIVPEQINAIERGACIQNHEVDQKFRKIRRDGPIA